MYTVDWRVRMGDVREDCGALWFWKGRGLYFRLI